MSDCVFCQIVDGLVPASIVYSDDDVMAFLDIQPINLGHMLIIPKVHSSQLSELDEEIGARMFKVGMKLVQALKRSGIKCEGVNLHLADGQAAGQEVFHVHLHVIPRFTGDGFRLKCGPDYGMKPKKEELDKIAQMIKEAIH